MTMTPEGKWIPRSIGPGIRLPCWPGWRKMKTYRQNVLECYGIELNEDRTAAIVDPNNALAIELDRVSMCDGGSDRLERDVRRHGAIQLMFQADAARTTKAISTTAIVGILPGAYENAQRPSVCSVVCLTPFQDGYPHLVGTGMAKTWEKVNDINKAGLLTHADGDTTKIRTLIGGDKSFQRAIKGLSAGFCNHPCNICTCT